MDLGWKAAQAAAVVVAGLATNVIVKTGWKLVTGHNPPLEENFEAKLSEVLIMTVLSSVILALFKRFTVKQAAHWYGGAEKPAHTLAPTEGK